MLEPQRIDANHLARQINQAGEHERLAIQHHLVICEL